MPRKQQLNISSFHPQDEVKCFEIFFMEVHFEFFLASDSVLEQWMPINTEEKKKYDREFLLGFQFISASMNKPEGLPAISDVVLDKV